MFAEERKNYILQFIQSGTPVKVSDLSENFEVSETTVRRDLQEMEEEGLLLRTHGGAIPVQPDHEMTFAEKEIRFLEEKRKIAKAAAELVNQGDVVLLDAGTTTFEIAKELRNKQITIATNSMNIAELFIDISNVEVWMLGGVWRKNTRSLVGYLTNQQLQNLHFDKVFLAANAVDVTGGATTPNPTEAETKRNMVFAGDQVVLVIDHSKLGYRDTCKICNINELDTLIIDDNIPLEQLEAFSPHIEVIIAK